MSSAAADLPRLLLLVPYLVKNPGVTFAQATTDLGTTEAQLRKDLELLRMCGVSKYYTDSLIDVDFDGDAITMYDPQGVKRPLRLLADEAMALLVALRALADSPGLVDAEPVHRALAKVEAAAGAAAGLAGQVSVELAEETKVLREVRDALANGRAVRLEYWTASRDATSERIVDPVRLLTVGGKAYLEGWCRLREDVRTFHVGRIQRVEILDEPSAPPVAVPVRETGDGLFQPSAQDLRVRLALTPAAAWVAEYYPTESVTEDETGTILVTLRARDEAGVPRLVRSLGGAARLLEPAELADQVRADARMALAAYAP